MNTACMLEFTEHHRIPSLNKADIVVMDGLNIHKNVQVQELIENAGAKVLILPAYSPEIHPIEHLWSTLKAKMCALGCWEWDELASQVRRIWKELPLKFYENWVQHCGYQPTPSA
jgi:transposase